MLINPSKAREWVAVGRTKKPPARAQLGPVWLAGPPVVSPSSCSIPWHRGIICPCRFRDIHHLITLPPGPILLTREIQAGGSQSLPEVSRTFFLSVWRCGALPLTCDSWKHTVIFASCRLDGLCDIVPWRDVQGVLWAEQLLLRDRTERAVLYTPLTWPTPRSSPTVLKWGRLGFSLMSLLCQWSDESTTY